MIYKIISKLIAERLKNWLGGVISEEQSGFVEGHQILDGVVIATKTIHSMAASKEKAIFIKLDMQRLMIESVGPFSKIFLGLLALPMNGSNG